MRRTALRALCPAALAGLVLSAAACGGRDAPRGDPFAGELVVERVEPACSRCHTLSAAGWEGTIGPSLDERRPGYQQVLDAIRTGPGFMPSYGELGREQQQDVAAYVSRAAAAP